MLSCVRLFVTHGLYSPWNSPGPNTGVGSLSLLQGIFPARELNPGLLHCRWILYQLSHKGSPRILKCVAYPFSSGSSQPRNRIRSPALQADSLPTELSGKPGSPKSLQMVTTAMKLKDTCSLKEIHLCGNDCITYVFYIHIVGV